MAAGRCLTVLLAAAAAAALAAASSIPYGPPAYAQGLPEPPTVAIGALMTNGSDQEFDDAARIRVLEHAVEQFNMQSAAVRLDLNVTVIERGAEAAGLIRAYAGGSGPSFYIGPTTDEGLANIMGNDTSGRILGGNVTLVSPSSSAPGLAIAGDSIFRLAVGEARQGGLLAGEMASAGIATFVTVAHDDARGRAIAASANLTAAGAGVESLGTIWIERGATAADWGGIAGQIAAAVSGRGENVGVLFAGRNGSYANMSAAAHASAALRQNTTWFAPSAALDASLPIPAGPARNFSAAVGLTALGEISPDNGIAAAVRSHLMQDGPQRVSIHEYSTYDSVFVLGNAIAAAGGPGANASSVGAAIPSAALNYTGALGDLLLDANGDLRSPDALAVWRAGQDGNLSEGAAVGTPVARVGALLALGHAEWPDDLALDALRLAAADYNAGERGLLVKVVAYNITGRDVPGVLRGAHAGGAGPSAYVGPSLSSGLEQVADYADDNGIILLSTASEAHSLSIAGDNTFRLAVSADKQAAFMAQTMAGGAGGAGGAGPVVTVVRDDVWGRSLNSTLAAELASRGLDVAGSVRFGAGGGDDWASVVGSASSAVAGAGGGNGTGAGGGNGTVLVAFIGFVSDLEGLTAAAGAAPPAQGGALAGAEWFIATRAVSSEGFPAIVHAPTRAFASDAANFTAIDNDVADNPRLAAFREAAAASSFRELAAVAWFYEFAAYDALFILADAVRSSAEAGRGSNATALRAAIPAAAEAYEGLLGDIALNSRGDLLTPDRFAVLYAKDGAWVDTGVRHYTLVVDVGALLMLGDSPDAAGGRELAAMRLAVDDFNADREPAGDFYINLAAQPISASPDDAASPNPDALAGLEAAHAGGSGPYLYVGPSTDGNAQRVLDYANANNIVLISHASSSARLAVPDDNLFRMAAPDALQGAALGGLIFGEGRVTDLVMAVRDDPWGRGIGDGAAARAGVDANVTRIMFAGAGGADWAGTAARLGDGIAAAAASAASRNGSGSGGGGGSGGGRAAVLFVGSGGDLAGIAAQAASLPQLGSVEWFGPGGGSGIEAAGAADAAAAGFARQVNMTIAAHYVAPNDVNRRLDPLAAHGPSAYDSVRVLGSAIKAAYDRAGGDAAAPGPPSASPIAVNVTHDRAGGPSVPPSAAAVKAAIPAAARAYAGALGNVSLDANGDLSSPGTYAVYRMGEGDAWALVRTVDAGTGPADPPAPPAAAPAADCSDDAIRCITIGELYTVEFASFLREMHYAYELAVNDFNREQAALNGTQRVHLALQRADISRDSPVDGLRAAHANGTGPAAYLGPGTSRTAAALAPFINANDIVLVSVSSASQPALVQPDNLFRVSLNDKYEADLLVIAAEREGVETIIPVIRNDTYGHSYDAEIRIEGDLLGMTVLDPVVVPAGAADLSALAAELNRRVVALGQATDLSKAALVTAMFAPDLHNLAHHAVEYPSLLSVNWFAVHGLHPPRPVSDPETLRLAQSAPLFTTTWALPESRALDRIDGLFRAEFGHTPSQFAYAGYDSVFLLADAANRSLSANGTYTGADVAANMHWAAERLDGLLGSDFEFDANGDRVSPSSVVIWRSAQGTGVWAEVDRVHLDLTCGLSLGSRTIAFGDVRSGAPSSPASQSITSTGTSPIDTIEIRATPWNSAATGAVALQAGATEVMSAYGGLGGAWAPLAAGVTMGEPGGPTLPELTSVEFRVNAPADTPRSGAGPISQTITYVVTCHAP